MCMTDDCGANSTGSRFFLVGAATIASVPLWNRRAARAQEKQPETRVLDDIKIQHGKVTFKHGGKETIGGFIARPKPEGAYPAVLVIAGNRISLRCISTRVRITAFSLTRAHSISQMRLR